MDSLYDSLHVSNSAHPTQSDVFPEINLTGKAFAEAVVNSAEFRRYIASGVVTGDLPHQILVRLMDHAWGQPVKRVEVEDKTPRQSFTKDELLARIAYLQSLVEDIDDVPDSPSTDDTQYTSRVH